MELETKLSEKAALKEYDERALTKEEQDHLNQIKIKTRIESERYLRSHPEIHEMLARFVNKVLLEKPEDVKEFAADYFNDPSLSLNEQETQSS